MRVAVIGANGQLGTDVCRVYASLGHAVVPLTHAEIDVRDRPATFSALRDARPDVVVNTAAMHNVEACETDPEAAFAVNATGPQHLAEAGRDMGFTLTHVSTDYVFGGEKGAPYVETDAARPVNMYGKSKLRGEELIADTLADHFIVRTSGLYGCAPCRAKPSGNFVQLMLRLARERGEVRVVTDEKVTPTYTEDLAQQIARLTNTTRYGVYHATCQGETSWFDYARAIFDMAGIQPRMIRAVSADFPQKAPRPRYSVLENAALRANGLDIMPDWQDSLRRYLAVMQ